MTTPHEKVKKEEETLDFMLDIQAMIQQALIDNDLTPDEALKNIEDSEDDDVTDEED